MNGANPPSSRGSCQDHGFSREIIDRFVVKLSGHVKGARDPGGIAFLPDDDVALCARHSACIGDVLRQMFTLIFIAGLNGATSR